MSGSCWVRASKGLGGANKALGSPASVARGCRSGDGALCLLVRRQRPEGMANTIELAAANGRGRVSVAGVVVVEEVVVGGRAQEAWEVEEEEA